MSLYKSAQYRFMKDLGAPALFRLQKMQKKRRARKPNPHLGPPLKCAGRLREIMTRHYYLSRFVKGAKPVAWVTSGAPVELLRVFDFYTVYPENHGALCGAQKLGPELCSKAEERGYHPDLCSYARIDLGHAFSGKTPAGRLPRPDLLFCCNNICQTVLYWFKELSYYWGIPLIVFDTPFNFKDIRESDIRYMVGQFEEMIPQLEKISGRKFSDARFKKIIGLGSEASLTWGKVLATMKHSPAPMTIFDAFVHMAPVVSLRGLPVSLDYYRILLEELEDRIEKGIGAIAKEEKRLMWDNIAVWFKLRDWSLLFAERGFNFVAATYTNAWAETIHYLDPQSPFESMARAYSLVILNNNMDHRLKLMERMIRDYRIDGLVILSLRSCKPYSVGQYDIRRLLGEGLGVKTLVIEADMTDFRTFSEEQNRTRLDAFFEQLEA
ncbi:MAG: 2-hydroxyacyl-CoA dehydratase [Deltaproteobacteria bacterium]|nr:2-hydroxyacyl-CoA dehydratase [Deltaproteobacteria bacterium]